MLTLFSFDVDAAQDVGRWVKTKFIEGKGPRIYQIVPTFDHQGVFYCLLNACLMLAFKLRPSLHCTKQKEKESVTITKNTTKLKMTGRNTDAPKVGVPHWRNNLGISPQFLLEGVLKSSSDTKKKIDFQYLKDKGKPLTILVFLSHSTNSYYPNSLNFFKRYR